MNLLEYYPEQIAKILETDNFTESNGAMIRNYFLNPDRFDPQKRTIIFSTPSRTGTSAFRIETTLFSLAKHFPEKFNLVYADNNLNAKHLEIADLIIAHRAGHLHRWMHQVMKAWPKNKKRPVIIHNVDDNEFNLPNSHSMKTMWIESGKHLMSVESLKESDYVITTGRKLQQTFLQFNSNVKIFPNMFNWNMPQWKLERTTPAKEGKLVIGWVGLTSHFEDLKKMVPILKYIHDKYPHTEFILAGMALKDTMVNITIDDKGNKVFKEEDVKDETQTYKYRVKQLYKDFDSNRIQFFDALPLEEYAKFYAMLDISLCYIEKNTFNQCKSPIKAIEGMYYKNITISTNFGGYNDLYQALPKDIVHKYNFVESEFTNSWKEAVEYWINNYQEGLQYAEKQSEFVKHYYNINETIHRDVEFFNEIIEKHEEKEVFRINELN